MENQYVSALPTRAVRLVVPFVAVAFFSAAAAADAAAPEPPAPSTTSTIQVTVGTLRNRRGSLGCRLYRSADGFPESPRGVVQQYRALSAPSVNGCTFENVAPGTYAIAIMHDENDNKKLDKNFIGVPTEGYGVSNNHTHSLSAPTWDESKFVVERGKNLSLGVGLHY